jgi:hypothetical protein
MKKIWLSALFLVLATVFFILSLLELYFPDVFALHELLLASWPLSYQYQIHITVAQVCFSFLFMGLAWVNNQSLTKNYMEFSFRIGLGLMFILASIFKIADPQNFAVVVAQYQFLPNIFNNGFALFMPMLEFIVGMALIFTRFTRENAILIFWMFIAFMIALAWAILKDLGIVCGCFDLEGAQDKSEASISFWRDFVLLFPTLFLCFRPNRYIWQIWQRHPADKVIK